MQVRDDFISPGSTSMAQLDACIQAGDGVIRGQSLASRRVDLARVRPWRGFARKVGHAAAW